MTAAWRRTPRSGSSIGTGSAYLYMTGEDLNAIRKCPVDAIRAVMQYVRQPSVIGWQHPFRGLEPTMRVIERRLRALEDRFVPRQRTESPLVAILRERRRRRAEAEGRQ